MGILSPVRQGLDAIVPGLPLADLLLGEVRKFDKGFVFEIVDTSSGKLEVLRTKSLVINPKRYHLSEPFASQLTPAEDNTVVAEENGIIIREIVLEGTTGLKERKEDALGRGGRIGTQGTGTDHFMDLRDMFREYSLRKQDPERGSGIRMFFHNVNEDDHFVVVPRAFETPRDATVNPIHFMYRITLAAIQEIPPAKLPGDPFDFLGGFGDTVQKISEAVTDARTFFVDSINEVEALRRRVNQVGAVLDGDLTGGDAIDALFDSSAEAINGAHDLVDGVVISIALGRELYRATLDLEEDFREQILNEIEGDPDEATLRAARTTQGIADALADITARGTAFVAPLGADIMRAFGGETNLTPDDLENQVAGATPGSALRATQGSERNAGNDISGFNGSERHTVSATDSIDKIALDRRVPRDSIIELNRLAYPYIAESGGPRVKRPGDTILIPTRVPAARRLPAPAGGFLTPDEIVYGSDIALDPVLAKQGIFDILIDDVHGSDDVQIISGVPNVIQGVKIILGTERGTTDFILDLGIRRLIGGKGTLDRLLDASLVLREAVLADDRVAAIDSIDLILEGDVLSQEMTLLLKERRDDAIVQVPVGTVQGE